LQTDSFLTRWFPLLMIFLIGTGILTFIGSMTEAQIMENTRQRRMDLMSAVLPQGSHENRRAEIFEVMEPELAGDDRVMYVYRQWSDDQPDGISLFPVIARGYSSRIILSVGITPDNTISGVRVIEQNESSGLGDQIQQSKSDWLHQFNGRSLDAMQPEDWAIRNEQGQFDALAGATITSRSVINAVHKAAETYAIRKETFYSLK